MKVSEHSNATRRALINLRRALERAWDADTSSGEHCPARPSAGQCAVTALIVQDLFGGELLRVVNLGTSHYWNRVHGFDVDLTRDQFPVWAPDGEPVVRDRSYVLANSDTARRYDLLRGRVWLGGPL